MIDLEALIKKCKARDEKSQQIVYEYFKKKWLGISVRYAKDFDDAKDIFQEASVRIFMELNTLKDTKAFEGWASRIIVNAALSFLKRKKSYLFTLQKYTEEADFSWTTTDQQVVQEMDHWKLMDIINTLPEGYRVVFNLFMIDGYKHAEIAEMLGIAESTSRSQLNKAKQLLKTILDRKKFEFNAKIIG
jgi:RNA polymerase sigma factor (sigma-70 family)